jgi:hypothetical protein
MATVSKTIDVCTVDADEVKLDVEQSVVNICTDVVCESNVPMMKSFSFDVDCIICGNKLKLKDKKGCMKKVCYLSKKGTVDNILAVCKRRTSQLAMDVNSRISSTTDLMSVCARYHATCLASFMKCTDDVVSLKSEELVTGVGVHEPVVSSFTVTDSQQTNIVTVGLSNLIIDSCGASMSHQDYLMKFATVNHFNLVDTVGGGNCFFDAVRQCIAPLGLIRTVRELRLAAAFELTLNSDQYSYVDLTEQERGQRQQSVTYGEFVNQTRDGLEWATQVTVAAMARSL